MYVCMCDGVCIPEPPLGGPYFELAVSRVSGVSMACRRAGYIDIHTCTPCENRTTEGRKVIIDDFLCLCVCVGAQVVRAVDCADRRCSFVNFSFFSV